jgi:conjugative transfer signal peptidase TraF
VYLRVNGSPQREDYASTCLTRGIAQYGINRGYLAQGNCDTGTILVLKKIKGLPGDHFVIQNNFFYLNGYSYRIMEHDSNGRPLKIFYDQNQNVIDQGKYILLSDFAKNSWDSRYWGPVSIQFLLKPLWLFENDKR